MTPQIEKWILKYLLARLGEMWGWYGPRKLVKQRALVMPHGGRVKDAMYRCQECKLLSEKVQIDHKVAKGPAPQKLVDLPAYLERYFCSEENLQALCLPCHKLKTKEDMKGISLERRKKSDTSD